MDDYGVAFSDSLSRAIHVAYVMYEIAQGLSDSEIPRNQRPQSQSLVGGYLPSHMSLLFRFLAGKEIATEHDREYSEALDSFVLLLDQEGTIIYVSNNITKHLGISAVSTLRSLYDAEAHFRTGGLI